MQPLTSVFKLLSDETRLRLLMILFKEDLCVCEISGVLQIPQPKISKSLSKLRDLDLVKDRRQEKFVYYSLKQTDPLLLESLGLIQKNLHLYPALQQDRENLKTKLKFSSQCCPA